MRINPLLTTSRAFTLIELMIVIAIVGILAAIAIPNFIAYRNKSFCSQSEADARSIVSAIADYFSVPPRNNTPAPADLNDGNGYTVSANNTIVAITGADPNVNITIVVNDGSGRCPADYQAAMNAASSPGAFWDGANNFTLLIQ